MPIEGKMEGAAEIELGRTLAEISGSDFHTKVAGAEGTPEEGVQKRATITKIADIPLGTLFQNEIFQKAVAEELDAARPEIEKAAALYLRAIGALE